jgi:hypothetical protein
MTVANDEGNTCNFEVSVDGTLLHSKKTAGHGFLHSNQETLAAVKDAVKKKLA